MPIEVPCPYCNFPCKNITKEEIIGEKYLICPFCGNFPNPNYTEEKINNTKKILVEKNTSLF